MCEKYYLQDKKTQKIVSKKSQKSANIFGTFWIHEKVPKGSK
jgi:hypothetical protein